MIKDDDAGMGTTPAPGQSSETGLPTTTVELDVVGGESVTEHLTVGQSAQVGRNDFAGQVSDQDRQYISGTHLDVSVPSPGTVEVRA
ncbi:hypothetical protein C454_00210 [Haloferax gibbonsii ATCC 33959]|uniref:FHA domain-containing protein n=1 Tax=Haloferax gibbonsii (strain ATCC 33959 / DSM 4427 / JCM 8863 / NBRC 102184 / NCIMB 2188 / Ma 2.38) TaxID=1227459 RepID=M0HQY7_HALGM|nr:hypothetical protein C454_00210 [Haloferax gibbonsii ATCC 33959]